jgi:type II secretory pathway component PulF
MLHGGLSLLRALEHFHTREQSPTARRTAERLLAGVREGESLAAEMARHPKLFSPLEASAVRAGESSGRLPETLQALAIQFEYQKKTRDRLVSGFIYPAILIHAAIFLPNLVLLLLKGPGAYAAAVLPAIVVLYGGVGAVFALKRICAPPSPLADAWGRIVLALPLAGGLIRTGALIRFLRTFVCLYQAGVHLPETLRLATDAMANPLMAKEMRRAGPRIENGDSLSVAFADNRYLPAIAKDMLQTGEESGKLDETLSRVTDYLQQELDTTVERVVQTLPVLVYLAVAAYIGFIVVRFYAGYFSQIMAVSGGE